MPRLRQLSATISTQPVNLRQTLAGPRPHLPKKEGGMFIPYENHTGPPICGLGIVSRRDVDCGADRGLLPGHDGACAGRSKAGFWHCYTRHSDAVGTDYWLQFFDGNKPL